MEQNDVGQFKLIRMVSDSALFLLLWGDRLNSIGDVREINAWVQFTFPGREDKYSGMKWNWDHFTGVDRVILLSLCWLIEG